MIPVIRPLALWGMRSLTKVVSMQHKLRLTNHAPDSYNIKKEGYDAGVIESKTR